MSKFPTIEEMARNVAEKALDEVEYNGKTLREWMEIILATDINVTTKLGTDLAQLGTDCISRQAAIDLLKQMRKDGDMVPWEGKDVFARIRELPAEPHWIPVTEATPTEDDDYWCTFDAETGRFVDWCSWYHGRWVVWTDDTVSEVSNVIAWCKPMEPYKGNDNA